MDLFECVRLRATISERQCNINRKGYRAKGMNIPAITTCQGCAGLGESAQITLPVQEEVLKKKKIECGRSGCGYGVKKEGDFCKKHQEPITTPAEEQKQGLDEVEAEAVQVQQVQEAVEVVREEVKEWVRKSPEYTGEETAVVVEPVIGIPVTEQNQELASPPLEGEGVENGKVTGLAALLRTPPRPQGLLIPFSPEELATLADSEVTAELIRDFVLMGLAGELQRAEAA